MKTNISSKAIWSVVIAGAATTLCVIIDIMLKECDHESIDD